MTYLNKNTNPFWGNCGGVKATSGSQPKHYSKRDFYFKTLTTMKTLAKVLEENQDLIVAFHIGRGGRFYNSGHLSYIGENTINNFTNDLFLSEDESEYLDLNGEKVGLLVENNGIGCIDIDGEYDTTYTCKVSDLNEKEIQAIVNIDAGWYGIFAQELSEVTPSTSK